NSNNFYDRDAHWLALCVFRLQSAAVLAQVDNGATSVLMYTLPQKFSIFTDVAIWDDLQGTICPRCCSLKSRYGDPKPCTICQLPMAFGSALVCQRCLHYRTKFGDPRQCEKCLHMCAFYKDEASRSKVDGQVLCWVCTYNYKMSKSKERLDKHQSKRSSFNDSYFSKSHDSSNSSAAKRHRAEEYTSRHSSNRSVNATNYSMDSAYNEHLLTIGQLQDDIKSLKRQLAQKDAELLAKDKLIAGLKSDLADYELQQRERAFKTELMTNEEIERLKVSCACMY
ncbi:Protein FAM76A, partial [Taenia solium]